MIIDINTLLAWGAVYKKVNAGDFIFHEGGSAVFYHQLVSGSVRWVNINEEGREFLQVMIEPGESFGELPLFDGQPYAASAIANEDSVVIRLQKEVFLSLLKENPEAHFTFTKLMIERVRFKFYVIKELAQHDPENCISKLFAYMKQRKKNICPDCNRIKLTRQQIADMTGMRVETVIRTIRSLHKKGQLMIDKGKVYC
ncbi:MAG: Crp/Fnr family transcriptional regulator [Sediminibacterium sp.]|nr:Crp/Fnr family transcriptional regulator [uncultured Sediminibacterium sp.]